MKLVYSLRLIKSAPSVYSKDGAIPSLLRFKLMLKLLGDPQTKLQNIVAIGSNGASRVAFMSAAMLSHGKSGADRCGFVCYERWENPRELIRLGTDIIPVEDFCAAATQVNECIKTISHTCENPGSQPNEAVRNVVSLLSGRGISPKPTREEIILAIACVYFASVGCSMIAVADSCGGKNDPALALPTAMAAVVTGIDDVKTDSAHTLSLIRKDVREVVGATQTSTEYAILSGKCARESVRCAMVAKAQIKMESIGVSGVTFRYDGSTVYKLGVPLLQAMHNAAAVVALATTLRRNKFKISTDAVAYGISSLTKLCGGVEVVSIDPLVAVTSASNLYYVSDAVESLRVLSEKGNGKILVASSEKPAIELQDNEFFALGHIRELNTVLERIGNNGTAVVICHADRLELTCRSVRDAIERRGIIHA